MTDNDTEIRIDKFTVLQRLGRGGMGAVYEGHDPALDRRVAIKTLAADVIADVDSRSRFEREARAAAKLQHPNIVTIYELGNFGGAEKPYIVMEYLEGTDVSNLIGDEGMPIAEALDIVIQLCRALDFAHQNGVVHRDIKPANLRCLDNGQIKIMDFGIARVEGSRQITKSGVMIGTVHYMSPEQIRGQKLDGRTDIFSAGCILYELLTGGRPFLGDSATSILYNIVNEQPVPVVEKKNTIPQEIQDVLERAMAKKAEDRFEHAGDMARELEKILSVYRKTLPRTTRALQTTLDELQALNRSENWEELVKKSRIVLENCPELEEARRYLRRSLRELHQDEVERNQTEHDRTRHLKEIQHELTELYGASVAATAYMVGEETELVTATPTRVASEAAPEKHHAEEGEGDAAVRALAAPIWALVIVVLLGLAGGLYWMFLREPPGPQPIAHTIRLSSEPPGAAVFLDGAATGLTTMEGSVELLVSGVTAESHIIEVRLDGFESASSELVLSETPPGPLEFVLTPTTRFFELVTNPEGVTVQLDGEPVDGVTPLTLELVEGDHEIQLAKDEYVSRSVSIAAGQPLPEEPIALTPLGRPGTFRVSSPYPVAIHRGNGVVASASPNPSVRFRPGNYRFRLVAPEVFLSRSVEIAIREGETTTHQAPPVGRVNVRAKGNCTVTIDGMPAGSPPFMNREVVIGPHEFVFTWAGNVTDTQSVNVEASKPTYVIGRRP
ncbi:MAG: serine/threonine protein kinase [Acidobacteria bacterium]|nr:MAG: serine/threonine protein kinase [Acidobacteriota bacterium]